MVRHALPVLLSCILFSGCATRGGRIAACAGTMLVGAMVMSSPGDTDHNTSPDSESNGRGTQVLGSALLITGAVLIVAGLASKDQPEQPAVRPAVQPAAYTQPYGYVQPYGYGQAYGYAQPSYPQPAYAQPVSYPAQPAYPPPYTSPDAPAQTTEMAPAQPARPAQAAIVGRVENRLALQASAAAHAGQCASAVITANKLAELDPELHVSLLERDTELALCYASSN